MAAPVATRSFVGCKTHGAPANDACTSCQAAIDKSVTEQVLASTQEATGEAAVCATCGGKRYVQERDPAVMPAWTYETAGYRRPCPDCTPRTETQDSAVEEAREAVMRSWGMMNRLYEEHVAGCPQFSGPQSAVIGPRDAERKSFWQLVTEFDAAISREAEERATVVWADARLLQVARAEAAERERDEWYEKFSYESRRFANALFAAHRYKRQLLEAQGEVERLRLELALSVPPEYTISNSGGSALTPPTPPAAPEGGE